MNRLYSKEGIHLSNQIKKTIEKSKLVDKLNEGKLDLAARLLSTQKRHAINSFKGGDALDYLISESSGGQPASHDNTIGNGDPAFPFGVGGDTSNQIFHDPNYQRGSGDAPAITLQIATTVAAATVGMDVVNTVPIDAPYGMLQYVQKVYANGTLDGAGENDLNSPIYVSIKSDEINTSAFRAAVAAFTAGDILYFYGSNKALRGKFVGFSKYTGDLLLKVEQKGTYDAGFLFTSDAVTSIAEIFENDVDVAGETAVVNTIDNANVIDLNNAKADYVQTETIFINGFANIDGVTPDPMRRSDNQKGTGNTLEAQISSKSFEVESYEVTYTVTRQQLQDYPLVNVDPISVLADAAQNEIVQSINADILKTIKRLGVSNAVTLKREEDREYNIFIGEVGDADEDLVNFTNLKTFEDKNGVDQKAVFTGVPNLFTSEGGETRQSKKASIASEIITASHRIAYTSRHGRANFIVVPPTIASMIRLNQAYTPVKFDTDINQNDDRLYMLGMLDNLKVYVDPNEFDNVIIIGRKGAVGEPGVYFMPYIIADHHTTVPEDTMGFKGLINTRYALVDAGWYPERHYLTIAYHDNLGLIR